MFAGGKSTGQPAKQRLPKWLNLRTVGLALAIFAVCAIPIAMQIKQLLLAEATWPGSVGPSIYRQGQSYTDRSAAIDRQNALGWEARLTVLPASESNFPVAFEVTLHDRSGVPVVATEPIATFIHPLQETLDHAPIRAEMLSPGRYRIQDRSLKAGRWRLQFVAGAPDGGVFRRDFDVQVPDR
ncbi:MAG: FixH family protein [Proteobacteria bacterium]|nr:FixH family protein [Pseudomonadota bacterium]